MPINGDNDIIIVVEHISKTFANGVKALVDFSTDIHRGEVVVVIGPSGSGKSTFLRCLNGLEEVDGGSIVIDGIPLDDNRKNRLEIRKEVGMVFQQFNLFPHMTVVDNVNLAQRRVRNKSKAKARAMSMDLLEKVGITEKADNYPSQLSGGQQQRVAIARALANDPAIILADEPTGNLDLNTGEEIITLLKRLSQERNVTVISATHDIKMLNVSDQVVWIRDGRIEKIEDRDQLSISIGQVGIRE